MVKTRVLRAPNFWITPLEVLTLLLLLLLLLLLWKSTKFLETCGTMSKNSPFLSMKGERAA